MNRQIFMEQLAGRLSGLPKAERDAALLFYNELFDEAGPENEHQVIADLGSPYQVAAKILAEFAAEQTLSGSGAAEGYGGYHWHDYQTGKRRISWLWYIVIGILAAPVAFPVAVAAISIIIGVLAGLCAVVIAIGACMIAWVVAAFALFFFGAYTTVIFPPAGICMLGVSLIMASVALVMFLPARWAITFFIDLITRGAACIFNRVSGGSRA